MENIEKTIESTQMGRLADLESMEKYWKTLKISTESTQMWRLADLEKHWTVLESIETTSESAQMGRRADPEQQWNVWKPKKTKRKQTTSSWEALTSIESLWKINKLMAIDGFLILETIEKHSIPLQRQANRKLCDVEKHQKVINI